MIFHIIANLLKIWIVSLLYCKLTDEYRLPHELEYKFAAISNNNTIMLTKNEKHYDGLILNGQSNLYLYLKRANIFDNQIYVIYQEASVFNACNHQLCSNLWKFGTTGFGSVKLFIICVSIQITNIQTMQHIILPKILSIV